MSFEPIRTARLLLRAPRAADADALFERRNEPLVARHQDWETPYPRDRAERLVAACAEMGGPQDEEWWMITIADPDDAAVIGDLALHMTNRMRTAEVGYTLAAEHWGQGYAVEALDALVDHLFDAYPVTRIFGMLHPDNRPSAQVLERTGFRFEGHTRLSYWAGDDNSDDWIYGLVREDREEWRNRPRTPPERVRLVTVTPGNVRQVLALATHKSQEAFVATMGTSLAQALVGYVEEDGSEVEPWHRVIEADAVLAGFVMVALRSSDKEPFLWRLLVDRKHQRRGVASMAMDLVEDEMRARGHASMLTSYHPGRGSPEPFYVARGYEPTGERMGGEVVARKAL